MKPATYGTAFRGMVTWSGHAVSDNAEYRPHQCSGSDKLTAFMKLAVVAMLSASVLLSAPLRVAIIGLEHGHVSGFLNGGSALVPAGGALHRPDVEVVAIVEPRRDLFDSYSKRSHLPAALPYARISEMVAKVHPDAALVFTSTFGHTAAVEECAREGVHVMMEKPMAVTYRDALAIAAAAKANHVHVLVEDPARWAECWR